MLPLCQLRWAFEGSIGIERNPNNLNCFTVVYETTKGIFCRTIEEEASKTFNKQESRWELKWEKIHIGQPLTIHKMFVIYKDQIVGRVPYVDDLAVTVGDFSLPEIHVDRGQQ